MGMEVDGELFGRRGDRSWGRPRLRHLPPLALLHISQPAAICSYSLPNRAAIPALGQMEQRSPVLELIYACVTSYLSSISVLELHRRASGGCLTARRCP
ncbi:Os02g0780524 [Oryza sativa Japonica Group]|uniref:Os02g0780524 protein n=1 Tax=Oryza sativa subsp. japonica TaxID=39947 RepID=A0A0P0VQD9_ORYSJ|nr:Os02g0780524 [Oryza sativa Japonica Group]